MRKAITKSQIIIFVFTILFISNVSYAASTVKVLTTDHFKINYNLNDSGFAIAVAVKAESCNDAITAFLEMEHPSRINIFLSEKRDQKFFRKTYYNISNDLFFSSNCNFNVVESELYKNIFTIYLNTLLQNGKGYKIIGDNFVNALIQYPGLEDDFIETRISDLVNTSQISSIDLTGIEKYNEDEQTIIYYALIDFIISNYGKKILIQSLKDAAYYDNYYLSLSEITGVSIKAISDNFNTFLCKYKPLSIAEPENKKRLFRSIDEFIDISYSIADDNTVAVLQKNNNTFKILLKNGENFKSIILDHSESESFFSEIAFINNNQLAIVEILESGSTILCFDIKNYKFSEKRFLPSLYISAISPVDGSENSSECHYNMIFSARCGSASDIYTFNIKTGDFNILTETGNNYFPVSLKDKVYFIINNDKNSIVESDSRSGINKILFSTEGKISDLSIADENTLVFSTKIDGLKNILSFDLSSGRLRKVTCYSHSNLLPRISGKNIYFLSFYKSKYQLFFDTYNPSDF